MLTADNVLSILQTYRCRYRQYSDGGEGMLLIDALSPADDRTVERGEEELQQLASYIAAELPRQLVSETFQTQYTFRR
ncbi:MAG TPA: hypothetical protein VGG49_06195 [Steroidobacteraceae bacterium]|jgi:hypothetical protein